MDSGQPATGQARPNYRFCKKLIRFLGRQLNRIFLNEDFTLSWSFIPDYFISRYFLDLDIYYKEDCRDEDPGVCRMKATPSVRAIFRWSTTTTTIKAGTTRTNRTAICAQKSWPGCSRTFWPTRELKSPVRVDMSEAEPEWDAENNKSPSGPSPR